uniref:PHB domain-containing protein n=1 Tax=Macrostomum lignano TaxID=282301 RepID=A0A1I8FA13_9PLAT
IEASPEPERGGGEGSESDDERSEPDDSEEEARAAAAAAAAAEKPSFKKAARKRNRSINGRIQQKKPPSILGRSRHQQHKSAGEVFSLVPERLGRGGLGGSMQTSGTCKSARRHEGPDPRFDWPVTFPFSFIFCLRSDCAIRTGCHSSFRSDFEHGSDRAGPHLHHALHGQRETSRPQNDDVRRPTQEVLTKDSVTVAVDAVVYYRIFDPVMSVVNARRFQSLNEAVSADDALRQRSRQRLYELLAGRDESAMVMQETLDAATDTWGVKVERVEIKDVRLPMQLQRAMAAEAEAAREARAKVIAAEGEQKASKALKAALLKLSECNVACSPALLQTLSSISAEKNSTIIFPLPIELLNLRNIGETEIEFGQGDEPKPGGPRRGNWSISDNQKLPAPSVLSTMSRGPDSGSKTSFGSGC